MTSEQRTAISVCMITMFLAPFMSSSLNLSVTNISSEFATGATTTTWVINAYTIGTAVFSMPLGHFADRTGRRRMILSGTAVFIVFAVVCMLAPNIWVLIGGRLAMSFGAAIYLAGNVPLMLLHFSPDEKGRMLGISVTAVYAGLATGPVIGGFINEAFGWRWIFAVGIAAAVVSFALTVLRIADDSTKPDSPLDKTGTVLFMVSTALIMVGLTEVSVYAWARVMLVCGVLLLVLFVAIEWRVAHPVVQVRLFARSATYALSNLAQLLSFGACFAVGYVIAIYLENVQGLDAGVAGLLMVVQPVCQAVVAPYSGRLSDRRPPRVLAFVGMLIIIVGLIMLGFVHVGYPLWAIVVALGIVGSGSAFFSAPNNNAILSCVDEGHYSEANSTIATMRGMGQSLSIVLVSFIFSVTIGNTVFASCAPADLADAVATIMHVSTVIACVAAACSIIHSRDEG